MSILFIVAVFGAALAGIIVSGGIPKGAKTMTCAAVTFIEEVAEGKPDSDWIGIKPSVDSINRVLNKFDTIVTNLSSVSTSFGTMDTLLVSAQSAVDDMYNLNANVTFSKSDPENNGTYTAEFIAVSISKFDLTLFRTLVHLVS